ncbi:hypothetical protein MES5069_190016 [Mesorhizobium escarrei]|uniref:Uncharacterized protein n=1 Tax=Mesorhizobium escarrei TaxID=666018 RepID=A0ABM9DNB1_9HYPH|nr:hypothetical protein MES5069_190016 [Mesorhizobium escarrei]
MSRSADANKPVPWRTSHIIGQPIERFRGSLPQGVIQYRNLTPTASGLPVHLIRVSAKSGNSRAPAMSLREPDLFKSLVAELGPRQQEQEVLRLMGVF